MTKCRNRIRWVPTAALAWWVCSPCAAQSYSITNLGTLAGYSGSSASAAGRDGRIVGFAQTGAGTPRPFTSDGGPLSPIGDPAIDGMALGVSPTGDVAGYSQSMSGALQAFLLRNGVLHNMGTLGGDSVATGVNSGLHASGWSRLPSGHRRATRFILDSMGQPEPPLDLGTLGGNESLGHGINGFGVIVGEAQNAQGQFRAYLHDGAAGREVAALGGSQSAAYAISNRGHIAGRSHIAGDGAVHAFLYDPDIAAVRDLGTLGGPESEALAVNDAGYVVGRSLLADGTTVHAFLWQSHTGMVDLNSLLPQGSAWELLEARGIRDDGAIVGTGRIGGQLRAFIMHPPSCDLGIALAATPNPAPHRRSATFRATVTNHGPEGAGGVLAVVVLPPDWPWTATTASQGTVSRVGNEFRWNVGSLDNGAVATVDLTLTANTEGEILARAAVSGNKNDPVPQNNLTSTVLVVEPNPESVDLVLQIAPRPEPVGKDRELTYDFVIVNAGQDTATTTELAVSLTDTLTFVRASVSQGTITFASGNEMPPAEHRNYVIGSFGVLPPGGVITGQFVLMPTVLGSANYIATAWSTQADADYSNNSREGEHTVIPPRSADVSVLDQGDSPDPGQENQDIAYAFRVTNNGPDEATAVRLVVTLAAGAAVQSHTTPRGTVVVVDSVVTFDFGNVVSGEPLDVTLAVRYPQAGGKPYTAEVSTGADDLIPANNQVSGSTTIVAEPTADLSITGQGLPNPIRTGNSLTYTFTVRNNGTDPATNVLFTGVLSAGQTFTSASASSGTPVHASGTVTCNLGTLAVGSTAMVTIVVTAAAPGTVSIAASVDSDLADSNAANNAVTPSVTVNDDPKPDLTGNWVNLAQTTRVVRGTITAKLAGKLDVRNSGEVKSKACVLRLYLSADDSLEEGTDRLLKTIRVPALRPGQVRRLKVKVTLPRGVTANAQHVLAFVDALRRVDEASETNNLLDFSVDP